jgi:hypothetical protein
MNAASALDKFVEVLTSVDPVQYWRSPLAGEIDSRMFDATLELYRLETDTRDFAVELIDERSGHTLAIFAERLASMAVTQQSSACLLIGLYALSLTFNARDQLESLRLLPVFYDAAQKCEVDAEQLFEKVGNKAPAVGQIHLTDFLSKDRKDLENYRFRFDPLGRRGLLYQRVD